jgi:small subunit ribosomal protein S20
MPITKSAQKALRQSETRRLRNLQKKNSYKNAVKVVKKLITEGKKKEAGESLAKAFKAIDKAAKSGVIKKNKAARLKSGASRLLKEKTA